MANILVLEDDDSRIYWFKRKLIGHNADFAKTVSECLKLLSNKEYTQIFLDHDLEKYHYTEEFREDAEDTGYAVAKFLHNNPDVCRDAEIVIHSLNPYGADAMESLLRQTRDDNIKRIPYLVLKQLLRD